MKLFKSLLLLALMFVAGLVVGVVGARAVVRHVVREAVLHPDRAQLLMERSFTRQLRLDNGQQVKLHQVLTDAHAELKGLRAQYQPQFFEVVSNAGGQINALLTPEQQARFEKLKSENRPLWQALRVFCEPRACSSIG